MHLPRCRARFEKFVAEETAVAAQTSRTTSEAGGAAAETEEPAAVAASDVAAESEPTPGVVVTTGNEELAPSRVTIVIDDEVETPRELEKRPAGVNTESPPSIRQRVARIPETPPVPLQVQVERLLHAPLFAGEQSPVIPRLRGIPTIPGAVEDDLDMGLMVIMDKDLEEPMGPAEFPHRGRRDLRRTRDRSDAYEVVRRHGAPFVGGAGRRRRTCTGVRDSSA